MINKIIKNNMFQNKFLNQMKNLFISVKKQVGDDLILIRHAESQFNTACEEYRKAHNIPYVWKQLCNHQGFDQKVLFNLKFIDCRITQKGKKQCMNQRKKLNNEKIDCVLVSPQLRTLETCNELFKEKKIPVIVQPLLVGPLRSCSDISKSTEQKKSQYPHFNFQNTETDKQLWFLDYLPQQQKKKCYGRFIQKKLFTTDQKRAELLELLKEGKIYQDAMHYGQRIQKLKQRILEFKNIYEKIAIVSHYYTIQYLSAVEYQKCGTPKFYIDVQNCTPYYCNSNEVLKSKITNSLNANYSA